MRILIVSDTHNYVGNVMEAIEELKPDYTFHLGDMAEDCDMIAYSYPRIRFNAVLGNNDFFCKSYSSELCVTIDNVKLFMCHGHTYRVKSGLDALKIKAKESGANIVAFGHTHQCLNESFDGINYVNPGSGRHTYAVIETCGGKPKIYIKEFGDYDFGDTGYSLSHNKLKAYGFKKTGNPLYFHQSVSSTFDELKKHPFEPGAMVVAKKQTLGRGRSTRLWQSCEGGIYFSFYIDNTLYEDNIQIVNLVCALAVNMALQKYGPAKIKWPNDIVLNGKKICGILTLGNIKEGKTENVCVGIGINVNNEKFDDDLPYATSLKTELGKSFDENEVLAETIKYIDYIMEEKNISELITRYKNNCITLNQPVTVHTLDKDVLLKGTCTNVLSDGTLEITDDAGKKHIVNSNEVSVRGLYGYV